MHANKKCRSPRLCIAVDFCERSFSHGMKIKYVCTCKHRLTLPSSPSSVCHTFDKFHISTCVIISADSKIIKFVLMPLYFDYIHRNVWLVWSLLLVRLRSHSFESNDTHSKVERGRERDSYIPQLSAVNNMHNANWNAINNPHCFAIVRMCIVCVFELNAPALCILKLVDLFFSF